MLPMVNCGPQRTDISDHRDQMKVLCLPPNCSRLHQPMGLELISCWKQLYRSMMLRKIVTEIETRHARCDSTASLSAGMQGFKEKYKPHMLDVATSVDTICWNVDEFARYRVKANVLPAAKSVELTAEFGCVQRESSAPAMLKMREMLHKILLQCNRWNSLYVPCSKAPPENDLHRWADAENDI